jgi:hypothetical protein
MMKVINVPVAHGAHVPFVEAVKFPRECDNRLESRELVCAFKDLCVTVDGVLDWERGNHTSDVSREVDEDFRPFRDLAAAGIAFKNHRKYKYRGSHLKQDALFQREFAAISRAGLGSMKNRDKFKVLTFVLDHDTTISKAELYILNPWAWVLFDDDAFWDMADAWIRYQDYESEYDLRSEDLADFCLLPEAVEDFRYHTYDLETGWVYLDWSSIDMVNTDDVPTAVIHMTLSKRLQDSPESFMAFRHRQRRPSRCHTSRRHTAVCRRPSARLYDASPHRTRARQLLPVLAHLRLQNPQGDSLRRHLCRAGTRR